MNRKFICSIFMLLMAVLTTSCSAPGAEGRVVSFTTDIQEDASYAVYCAIEGATAGEISKIEFEKGTYHFYPEKAKEKWCFISNHNDVLARVAFDLENLEGVTIEGNGSKFIFHGCMIPFWIEDSKDVTVQNLSIDFSEPFHAELVVVATNAKAKTIDFSISEDFPYEIRNDELFFAQPYYQFNIGQTLYYSAKTGGTAYANNTYSLTTWGKASARRGTENFTYKYKVDRNDIGIRGKGGANGMKAKELKPGLVRLSNQRKAMPPVGAVLTAKGDQGENRFAPAFKCNNVTNFYAQNVTIYHAGGMGFLFENCDTAMLEKCKIIPAKGRIISTTADATHFVGCRGKVTLKDCVFHSQLDDAMNVHGAYQDVIDILDSKTIGVRVGHYQQLGFEVAKPGDKVGLVRLKDSFHAYHTLTVKSLEVINGRYHRLTFVEDIPSTLVSGDLVENLSAYPEVLVEGCDISLNRARGLLISTPVKTTIRNNYFNTDMTAILVPLESSSWYESGNAANVTIENNIFQDCVVGGANAAVIRFHTDDDSPSIAFENIRIENNTFNHYDNYILAASNIDGMIFKGNTIKNSGTYPQLYPNQAAITVQYCKNIKFEDNKYEGKAKDIIKFYKGQEPIEFK